MSMDINVEWKQKKKQVNDLIIKMTGKIVDS